MNYKLAYNVYWPAEREPSLLNPKWPFQNIWTLWKFSYKILWKYRWRGKKWMLLHKFHPIVHCSVVAFWRKTATTTHLMCCRRCEVFCGYFFEFNIQNLGKTNICTYSLFHQYLHTVWTAKRVALLWYNIYLVYKWSLKNWHKWSNLYR